MKKLRLKISNISVSSQNKQWEEKVEEVLSLERKFQAIDVTFFDLRVQNAAESFVQIIACHGSQIREMVLRDVNFRSFDEFHQILKNVPLLESLEIERLRFNQVGKPSDIKTVTLKKLQTLKIDGSSWAVFQHLIGTQITSLTTLQSVVVPTEREYFINFLKASEKLESIELDFYAFVRVFEQELPEKLSFKLRKLRFLSYQIDLHEVDEVFNKFLIAQASNIEELELNIISLKVVETILGKLKCLKRLRLHSSSLSTDKEFYDFLKPIKSLKEVEAHDEFLHENAAKGLLGICPNLESLKAVHDPTGIFSNLLPFISLYNPKLKSLSIDKMENEIDMDMKFKNLEMFHVYIVDDIEVLLSFIKANPSIATLSCGCPAAKKFTSEVLEKFMNETSLKHLKFESNYETIEAIFNKIKVDYKKLKSLQLTEIHDYRRGTSLTFNFPNDPLKWEGKCDFFD